MRPEREPNLALSFMIDEVNDRDTAKRCLKAYVDVLETDRQITRDEAIDIAKSNLAHLAGFRDHATRRRVEALYNCVHPYLGPAEDVPDHEAAFRAGQAVAEGIQYKVYPQPKDEAI